MARKMCVEGQHQHRLGRSEARGGLLQVALLLRASPLWPGRLDPNYLRAQSSRTLGLHKTLLPPSSRIPSSTWPQPWAILYGAAVWPLGVLDAEPNPVLTLRGSQTNRRNFTPTSFLLRKKFS